MPKPSLTPQQFVDECTRRLHLIMGVPEGARFMLVPEGGRIPGGYDWEGWDVSHDGLFAQIAQQVLGEFEVRV